MTKVVKLSQNAQTFVAANFLSPVIEGTVKGEGGEGAVYTLQDGRRFELSADECKAVGLPRWKGL
jgi:hypothetical protein